MKKIELEKRLKSAENKLLWYAVSCPNSQKEKLTEKGDPTSLVADRHFKKFGYKEKDMKVIK